MYRKFQEVRKKRKIDITLNIFLKNMPWILIAILVLILVVFGVFLYWKKNKAGEAKQPRYLLGGAIGRDSAC